MKKIQIRKQHFIKNGVEVDNRNYINIEDYISEYVKNKKIKLDNKLINISRYYKESRLFYDKSYNKNDDIVNLPLINPLSRFKIVDIRNKFAFDFDEKRQLGYYYYNIEETDKNGKKITKFYRRTEQETVKEPIYKQVRKKIQTFLFYYKGKRIYKKDFFNLTYRQQNNVIVVEKSYYRIKNIITGYKTIKLRYEKERFYKRIDKKVLSYDLYVPYFLFMRSTFKKKTKSNKGKRVLEFYIGSYAVAPKGQKMQGRNTQRGEIFFNPILNNDHQIKVNPDLFNFADENKMSMLEVRIAEIFRNLGQINNYYVKKMYKTNRDYLGIAKNQNRSNIENRETNNEYAIREETMNVGFEDRIRLDENGHEIEKKFYPFIDVERIRSDKATDSYYFDIPIDFLFCEGRFVENVFDEKNKTFTKKAKFISVFDKKVNNHFTAAYRQHIKIHELGKIIK